MIKSKVRLSTYCRVITVLVTAVLATGCVVTFNETLPFVIVICVLAFLVTLALLYAPISISADSTQVTARSPLRNIRIPMDKIVGVERISPTMGAVKIFGCNGFMGYWGIFREGDIGRYYAFYGKASDCFLLRLENGDKYMLGCQKPQEFVDFISEKINC